MHDCIWIFFNRSGNRDEAFMWENFHPGYLNVDFGRRNQDLVNQAGRLLKWSEHIEFFTKERGVKRDLGNRAIPVNLGSYEELNCELWKYKWNEDLIIAVVSQLKQLWNQPKKIFHNCLNCNTTAMITSSFLSILSDMKNEFEEALQSWPKVLGTPGKNAQNWTFVKNALRKSVSLFISHCFGHCPPPSSPKQYWKHLQWFWVWRALQINIA